MSYSAGRDIVQACNGVQNARRYLRSENKKFGEEFRLIYKRPLNEPDRTKPIRAWRNKDFLVQEYQDRGCGFFRLTVNRTDLKKSGRFKDRITWDELNHIKTELGYGTADAVELYPRAENIIDDANMRHLWILKEPPEYGWTKKQ